MTDKIILPFIKFTFAVDHEKQKTVTVKTKSLKAAENKARADLNQRELNARREPPQDWKLTLVSQEVLS